MKGKEGPRTMEMNRPEERTMAGAKPCVPMSAVAPRKPTANPHMTLRRLEPPLL